MPTYDYLCLECGHKFEKFESINAKPSRKCPECGKLKLKRLIGSGAGIIFKGSGFYQTDYRSDSYKKAADKAEEASSGKEHKKKDSGEKCTTNKNDSSSPKKTT